MYKRQTPTCYGHCKEPSAFEFKDDSTIVQVCPGRYVSRIIAYGMQTNADQFERILRGLVQGMEDVESTDTVSYTHLDVYKRQTLLNLARIAL